MNTMIINGYQAVIQYSTEYEMLRGEFIGLNGGADFYAKDVDGLKREGEISLNIFLESCKEQGIAPRKQYSGKFMIRISPDLHSKIAHVAATEKVSINQWVAKNLEQLTI